jgi:hypothetical protein
MTDPSNLRPINNITLHCSKSQLRSFMRNTTIHSNSSEIYSIIKKENTPQGIVSPIITFISSNKHGKN